MRQRTKMNQLGAVAVARRLGICTAMIMMLAALLQRFPNAWASATITVNTLSDESTAGDGLCSLREAINNANAASDTTSGDCTPGTGNDTITFNVDAPTRKGNDKDKISITSDDPTHKKAITVKLKGDSD